MLHPFQPSHRHLRFAPLAITLAAGVAVAAPAGNADREIATAKVHATVATQIDTVAGAQLHLHHAVNCLVGPHGSGWDAAAEAKSENHCTGLGNGAIADSGHDVAVHHAAETALHAAQAGLKANTLDAVHRYAHEVLAALDRAQHAEPAKP